MRLEPESYIKIMEDLHDGLYFVDRNRVISFWNKAAERISGYAAAEVVGSSCADEILVHVNGEGCQLCNGMCPLAATMRDGAPRETEVYLHHKDGHRVPVSVRVSTLRDAEGNVIGGIELFTDISSQEAIKTRMKELEELAMLDNLTRLANRNYIEQELRNRFGEKKRFGVPFGILFMDIDHFKHVNDTWGHEAGDEVLALLARVLSSNARPFDLYGRWGGEEFIGILRNVTAAGLESIGNRMRILVENSSIMYEGVRLSVTVSLGATLAENDDSIETMMKRADSLLYQSKSGGRNRLTMG